MTSRPALWSHDKDHFFKYVTRTTARAILANTTLRWSSPVQFNDPFDIQFDLHIDIGRESLKAKALDALWGAHYSDKPITAGNVLGGVIALFKGRFPSLPREEFDKEFGESFDEGFDNVQRTLPETHAQLREIMRTSKILCLSEVNNNILMWSHYAEQHQGVVLQLRCVAELDSAWGVAKPVQYSKRMPRLFDEETAVKMFSGQTSLDGKQMANRLVYTKAIDWAYEKEWRIWLARGRSTDTYDDLQFDPTELEAIYLGCRMPEEDRLSIASLVADRYPHAKVIHAKKSEREFRLVFEAT